MTGYNAVGKKKFQFAPPLKDDTFGGWLRNRRLELGLNQSAFATRCGLHQAEISKLENGKRGAVKHFHIIERIESVVGKIPKELLA